MATLHEVRYYFEHRYLPQSFFKYEGAFVTRMVKEPITLYNAFSLFCKNNEVKNPYTEEQFRADFTQMDENTYCLAFTFPEPEDEPLCKYAYLFCEEGYKNLAYFTIEKGNKESDKEGSRTSMHMPFFVCGWMEEGIHTNYGVQDIWQDDGIGFCFKLYKGGDFRVRLDEVQHE